MEGQDGAECGIAVRVTPRAARARVEPGAAEGDPLRVHVTVPPEGGKANAAVRKLLAAHLGVAPSRLTLLRGAKGRDKLFRLD
ncbi:hypothetical protein DKT77_16075 [Meridianimarinicoccus roseus]|uniref:UPF0235 protein DKT77_16075 n=1 Tax=Meridianimarinicoccus roseus TaxID=2072018 RepID=A0A2V2L8Q6_9RHOB|nr:DUF167 domain-containing protein [Meridianimarinicoccus roseus]PWR01770.1 hypothetical protein DKT77_16075 [Meridianimarinicoccus roseus]